MSLISSMLKNPEGPPHIGIPVVELFPALKLIENQAEFIDRRIMSLSVRNNGMILIKTGEQPGALTGGGYLVLLERTNDGWRIVESTMWCS